MYRYGFELEGLYAAGTLSRVPPVEFPTDGFPGLIEIRTQGHDTLSGAYGKIIEGIVSDPIRSKFTFEISDWTFSPEEKRILRKRDGARKSPADIQNIYGKKPRPLGNKTIASLQINISNLVRHGYQTSDGKSVPDVFTLLDVPRIVKALDKAFEYDIKKSKRQPGEYCIKGDRLEYRSLPNSAWPRSQYQAPDFLDRIKKAVESVT